MPPSLIRPVTKLEDRTARTLFQRLTPWPTRTITTDIDPEHTDHSYASQRLGVSFFVLLRVPLQGEGNGRADQWPP